MIRVLRHDGFDLGSRRIAHRTLDSTPITIMPRLAIAHEEISTPHAYLWGQDKVLFADVYWPARAANVGIGKLQVSSVGYVRYYGSRTVWFDVRSGSPNLKDQTH
jgi:hypothetical protein